MFFEDEKTDKKCSREGGKGLDESGGKSRENTKHSKNRELGLGSVDRRRRRVRRSTILPMASSICTEGLRSRDISLSYVLTHTHTLSFCFYVTLFIIHTHAYTHSLQHANEVILCRFFPLFSILTTAPIGIHIIML